MKRFGTFEGVFIPCILSILGVIMYLRLGWVVGHVGLGQALIIIVFSNLITFATALSMSSIVTNIRIGTGGAYSIITKSLGVEAGGAIGLPLYLSQAVSVAFYIAGFTECWMAVFPQHPALLVSLITWFILMVISYISAQLAFRIQYGILFVIAVSLASIFLSQYAPLESVPFWNGGTGHVGFWPVFAIFFPAVTGVLAGASMSGELKDPKVSIPTGTLAAIGVSFCIYVSLAFWIAYHVVPAELVANTSILIDAGRWRVAVIAGIMGATLSSALSMLIGAPRTLLALGKHNIVPFSKDFARINVRGEPTAAILFTALLALLAILLGTLDKVAALLTMFFLITYGMINLSVFVEQTIGIISFRPTFRVWRFIPFLGSIGCLLVMFLINVWFSGIAIVVIIGIYVFFVRREMKIYSPDVRSGLLLFLAERFANMAAAFPYHPKIWKPNVLIPVGDDVKDFSSMMEFIADVVRPSGRTIFCKVLPRGGRERGAQNKKMSDDVLPLKEYGIFVETAVVESSDFASGVTAVMQTVKGLFFPPNTFFCILADDTRHDKDWKELLTKAEIEGLGLMVLKSHPAQGVNQHKVINLWIRRQSPNFDLSMLIALQLKKNWDAHLRIIQAVDAPGEVPETKDHLLKLKELMRMPGDVETDVLVGPFRKVLLDAPASDLHIFGMPDDPGLALVREVFGKIQASVLFLKDSKHERATA